MANSNKNVLGIEAIGAPQSTFAQIRTQVTDRTIGTAFRDGWQGDYPSMMEFLEPLFVTGAGSNDVDYSPGVRRGRDCGRSGACASGVVCADQRRAASPVARHAVIPLWDYTNAAARLRAHRQELKGCLL